MLKPRALPPEAGARTEILVVGRRCPAQGEPIEDGFRIG